MVTFAETNLVGNVYFAEYARWQGICREHFLYEHAPESVRAVAQGELALVTVDCALSFHSESFAADVIDIEMTLRAASRNRISMAFVYRRGSDVIATGTQSIACMQRADSGLIPVEIPEDLASALRKFGHR
jgi:enediyne biosynthesis thioesterase